MSLPPNYNYAEVLNAILSQLKPEDPFKYLEVMYSCNPAFILNAIDNGKEKLQKLNNKKGVHTVDVYFTLGKENATRSRFSGFFSGLLWIEDYIRSKASDLKITNEELKTFTNVMRKAGLPSILDMHKILEIGDTPHNYSVKTYAACLGSYMMWLSTATLANKAGAEVSRSNAEACNLLVADCLKSYPALPFTSYYLGTIKTNDDPLTLSEQMYKDSKFSEYVTDKFAEINAPSFMVCRQGAPVVNCINHPLCVQTIGLTGANGQDSRVDWHAGFATTQEFDNLCQKHNTSARAVSKYMILTSLEQHKDNIQKGDPLALFIDQQAITKEIYERLRKSTGLIQLSKQDKAEYE